MKSRLSLLAPLAPVAVLALLLGWLFRDSFDPRLVIFANDGTLGILASQADIAWTNFIAYWQDLNWLGAHLPAGNPSPTAVFYAALGPILYSKFFVPIALLLLGWSAWFCSRRMGLAPGPALLPAIAAALNANPFSYACWGLPGRALAMGAIFVAVGLLQPGPAPRFRWMYLVLAGFAVGINVMEGADVGALLSLVAGAFVVWRFFIEPGPLVTRSVRSIAAAVVVAVCAAWIACSALNSLVTTSIKGVAVMQETGSDAERWDFITGWSFPTAETIRLIIPGIYGYRMDSPDGGAYWGSVGPDGNPASRFSGSGEYVGMWVLLVAAWGVYRSLRSTRCPYDPTERRLLWFWAVLAVVSLVLAFGRNTPFYRLIYPLPLFNSMRLPMKFLHVTHLSFLMLFAYGLLGISREMSKPAFDGVQRLFEGIKAWWKRRDSVDRPWAIGMFVLGGIAVLDTLVRVSSGPAAVSRLQTLGMDAVQANQIAAHSSNEIALALGWFLIGGFLLVVMHAGGFKKDRIPLFWILAGVLMTADLARSSLPWIRHYDYQRRYQTNPVIDLLKTEPHNGRFAARFMPTRRELFVGPRDQLMPVVHNQWIEHHFQFNRIQTLDIIQMPRIPELDRAYMATFEPRPAPDESGYKRVGRLWQLTNTRYLLAASGLGGQLNDVFAVPGTRWEPRLRFDLGFKQGVNAETATSEDDLTAVGKPEGAYAIFECVGALPRVGLYTDWAVLEDDQALNRLADLTWDPTQQVLLAASDPTPTLPSSSPRASTSEESSTNSPSAGTANITFYSPKRIEVSAISDRSAILLLNDRWHEDWIATVDGVPVDLLRANHIMRAVALEPGKHTVVFRFQPSATPLWISLSALIIGIGFAGFLFWTRVSASVVVPMARPAGDTTSARSPSSTRK